MKRLIALMMCAVSLGAAAQIEYPFPYNPDSDNSGWIGLSDLLSLLAVYDTQFDPETWQTDSLSAHVDLQQNGSYLDCINSCGKLTGAWRMTSLDEFGRGIDVATSSGDYWIASNQTLQSETLLYAKRNGAINSTSLGNGNSSKGCMCYIRAQAQTLFLDVLEENVNSAFQEIELRIDTLTQNLDSLLANSSTESVDTNTNTITLECVDMGFSPLCGGIGLSDNVTLGPTDGAYSYSLGDQNNPNEDFLFGSPHWRKFTIHGLPADYNGKIYMRYQYRRTSGDTFYSHGVQSKEPEFDESGNSSIYFWRTAESCILNGIDLSISTDSGFNLYSSGGTYDQIEIGYTNGNCLIWPGAMIDF